MRIKDVELRLESLIGQGFEGSYIADEGGAIKVDCYGCDAMVINSVACHEFGCPNKRRPCRECGCEGCEGCSYEDFGWEEGEA